MKISLEPYNYYILFASVILLIIFLFLTLKKMITLTKELKPTLSTIKDIKTDVTLAKIKVEAIKEKKAETHKNDKYLKVALPILLAIYNTYRQDEELKGLKGYRKATSRVMDQKMRKQYMSNVFKNMM